MYNCKAREKIRKIKFQNMFIKLFFVLFVSFQFLSFFVSSKSNGHRFFNNERSKNFELVMNSYERLLNEEPTDSNFIKLYVMNLWLKEFVKNELTRRIVQTSTDEDWYLRQG